MSHNLFDSLQQLQYGGRTGRYYSLPALEKAGLGKISRLPRSLRVVLESALRNYDGLKITDTHLKNLAGWKPNATRTEEVPFVVARVLLQDMTGVPLVVDVAAMRATPVLLHLRAQVRDVARLPADVVRLPVAHGGGERAAGDQHADAGLENGSGAGEARNRRGRGPGP